MDVQVRSGLSFRRHLPLAFMSSSFKKYIHLRVFTFYCCGKNYYELSGSKQHTLTTPQFLWVNSPGMAQLGFRSGSPGSEIKMSAGLLSWLESSLREGSTSKLPLAIGRIFPCDVRSYGSLLLLLLFLMVVLRIEPRSSRMLSFTTELYPPHCSLLLHSQQW